MARSVLSKLGTGISIAVALYAISLGLLLTPPIQRFALYAHKINTLFLGEDLIDPTAWGFAKNQVTPFTLTTPDGETLYGWHVLPLDIYARYERELRAEVRPHSPVSADDFMATSAFKYLTSDDARVVINFHGNAGHVAQGWRTDTYRVFAAQPNTHVLTIDYRGFGYSTGSPTEAGLILDGVTLVSWVLRTLHIPPERIVIVGQSLGTAVSSAVALAFADPGSTLIPAEAQAALSSLYSREATVFAGVILVAPFSSLPSLLLTYRIGGLLPILLPLRPFPYLANLLTAHMVDKWLSAERLAAYYRAAGEYADGKAGGSMGSLQVIHSIRDFDIPYHQTEMICRRMFGEGAEPGVYDDDEGGEGRKHVECIDGSNGPVTLDVRESGRPPVRFEIVEYGGHNRIVTYSQVGVAVFRAFEGLV